MNEEDKPEPLAFRMAAALRVLADRCDLNGSAGFGGAFMIMPPDGDAKELLLLNNTGDPAMFWGLLQSTAQIALAEIEAKSRQGFGGLR